MVLTPGYVKVITKVIASRIIAELRKPFKNCFSEVESSRVCESTLNGYFKDHERRTHKKIENERTKN